VVLTLKIYNIENWKSVLVNEGWWYFVCEDVKYRKNEEKNEGKRKK